MRSPKRGNKRGRRGRGFSKYSAEKARCRYGHSHASRREAQRCVELHNLQASGFIEELELEPQFWFIIDGRQVKHPNGRRVGYKADFQYKEGGSTIVEETKGMEVRDWPLRRAIFKALFPDITLRETK